MKRNGLGKLRISTEYRDIDVRVAIIGYNSKAEIDRCMAPFVGHVDGFILGDGKFDFYEGTDYSTDGWMEYAKAKYEGIWNTEVTTYKYTGKQIDKRQMYFDIAGSLGCDYLIVMDTDEYIDPEFNNWTKFYHNLHRISSVVDDKIFMMWEWIPNETLWPRQGNLFASDVWLRSARIHRDPAQQRYALDCHFMWCNKLVTDDQIADWQLKHRDAECPFQLFGRIPIEGVRIKMDRTLRTDDQLKKGAYWAHMNQHAENSRQYYRIAKLYGTKVPEGFKSWDEFEKAPHTFDPVDGHRIELEQKKEES